MIRFKPMMAWNLRHYSFVAFSGLAVMGLASCGYDQYLPQGKTPVAIASTPKSAPATSLGQAGPAPSYDNLSYRLVTVLPSDTLSKIAIRHAVPTKSVIALNKAEPPYVIHVGQQIKIPFFKMHRVHAGETLYAIARVYDVQMDQVAHFNFLETPYTLAPGADLKIPVLGYREQETVSADVKIYPVSRPIQTQVTEQIMLKPPPVIRTNKDLTDTPLAAPSSPGPVSSSVATAAPAPAPQAPASLRAVPLSTPELKSVPSATVPVQEGTMIAKADLPPLPRSRYSIKQPPLRDGKAFYWPVRGEVLSSYGKKKNGLHNDGINIKVIPGTPVKAAENGVVSYVGNEMRSFGNLILISHADGYVTTYGHTAQILVQKGDLVKKGDVIARAGSTGDVQIAQLHFEIRKRGTAVDPSRLLARN